MSARGLIFAGLGLAAWLLGVLGAGAQGIRAAWRPAGGRGRGRRLF